MHPFCQFLGPCSANTTADKEILGRFEDKIAWLSAYGKVCFLCLFEFLLAFEQLDCESFAARRGRRQEYYDLDFFVINRSPTLQAPCSIGVRSIRNLRLVYHYP